MLFNSYVFILLFLPLVLIGWFLLNRFRLYRAANVFLLAASLYFYAYFNLWYLPIILFSIVFNYGAHRAFRVVPGVRGRRVLLAASVLVNLGVIGYYKYYDFFAENINAAFGTEIGLLRLLMPLGISFFTFQQISFVVDCYRRQAPDYGLIEYALFVSYFPQLIAGPIVLHTELVPQFRDMSKRRFTFENFSAGLYVFAFGLAKKVLIADSFGNAVNWGYENIPALNSVSAAAVIFSYTMQIYFDFSGYCDMAVGVARMFNIELPDNFRAPYRAVTLPGFWERWHQTLTRFFTAYVYIPLGGSRKGKTRRYLNTMLVFLVSGLWHGAGWTFVVWGALNGIGVVLGHVFSEPVRKIPRLLGWGLTFGAVNLLWVFFRSPSLQTAGEMFSRLLFGGVGPIPWQIAEGIGLAEIVLPAAAVSGLPAESVYYVTALLTCAFALFACLRMKSGRERLSAFRPTVPAAAITSVLLIWSIVSLSGVSTFLYFNF